MSKEEIEHKDKLGRTLKLGDCVAYPDFNTLEVGIIKKINPKMLRIVKATTKYRHNGTNKYPEDVVLLEGSDVTMYILKNSSQ
jgi:hypothetical protein